MGRIIFDRMKLTEDFIQSALGHVEHIAAFNTYQVKNYDMYEYAKDAKEMKQAYKDSHWKQDLQNAFDAGKRMAERIMA